MVVYGANHRAGQLGVTHDRGGDPKGWSTAQITMLGSLRKHREEETLKGGLRC
jgi:hypothetical protein